MSKKYSLADLHPALDSSDEESPIILTAVKVSTVSVKHHTHFRIKPAAACQAGKLRVDVIA